MNWYFNNALGKWYHPTGATSDNGPNEPPEEPVNGNSAERPIKTNTVAVETVAPPSGCIPCGHKERQVR